MDEEIKIPTLSGSPISEHGQVMFTLGQIAGNMKGLKDAQVIANGRTAKIELKVEGLEKRLYVKEGAEEGVSKLWVAVYSIGSLVIGAIGAYVAFVNFIKK